jgi:uncharacterized membrane protein YjgN (DUF898 family)
VEKVSSNRNTHSAMQLYLHLWLHAGQPCSCTCTYGCTLASHAVVPAPMVARWPAMALTLAALTAGSTTSSTQAYRTNLTCSQQVLYSIHEFACILGNAVSMPALYVSLQRYFTIHLHDN